MIPEPPDSLADGGRALWLARAWAGMTDDVATVLCEACRAKDRLDKLDELLRGDVDVWARVMHRTKTEDYELLIDKALTAANATAGVMSRLLASLPAVPVKADVQGKGDVVVNFQARLADRTGAGA